jgi:signal transduction histidine kinase
MDEECALNPAEFVQLQEVLDACSVGLVEQWYQALRQASPAPLEAAEVKSQLAALVTDAITAFWADEMDVEAARALGVALMGIGDTQPHAVIALSEAFAHCVTALLTPEQSAVLQPRLVCFLGEMTVGFCSAKSAAVREANVQAVRRISHDLKTPINAVTGFSKVILKGIDGPITDFQEEDLTSIYEAGQHLLNMINDLSVVAKRDEVRKELYLDGFDVATLMGEALATAQPTVAKQGNALEVCAVGELGEMSRYFTEMRWITLSLIFFLNRWVEKSTLKVFLTRRSEEGLDWVVLHVTGPAVPFE